MNQQDELARLIDRHATEDGVHQTQIPRLSLIRASHPTEPLHVLHEPALCIVAQGRKRVLLGDKVYLYGRDQYLVVSVDLAVSGQVVEAEPEKPYLCFRLDLDAAMLTELLTEAGLDAATGRHPGPGLTLGPATPELLGAAIRLLRLLATPGDIGVLAPLAEREILYRLLTGDRAHKLRQIALANGRLQQVNRAISWIKTHYREPFRVELVASEARMGSSALHHHFKAVTSMSPLQYQKRLRLQEARRLILGASLDAATAGFSVGYDSPSQFSREYSRLFGAPPLRDTERLKTAHLQRGP
jgi:AraC-like DNA-binding protein